MARRKNDFYPTPAALTAALLDTFPNIGGAIYEPCNGKGAISDILRKHDGVTSVTTADIDPLMEADYTLDARVNWPWQNGQLASHNYDWVITNPPFSDAATIIRNIGDRNTVKVGMAMLLRLTFLEPVKEREWLKEYPPHNLIVLPRTSFTEDGKSDSVTCAWMVWTLQPVKPAIKVYTKADLQELVNSGLPQGTS